MEALPPPAAAGIVLLGFLAFTGGGFYYLAGPAADWIERAPETMRRAVGTSDGWWR